MDPRIGRIVDDISGLTLLQAADLVSLLKARTWVPSVEIRLSYLLLFYLRRLG